MSYDRHRATNRWAISTALLIWFAAQSMAYLEPHGVPGYAATSLAIAGMGVLPLLLAWPWVRRYFVKTDDEVKISLSSPETRYKTLVSTEIALLSAVLIFLLTQMPL